MCELVGYEKWYILSLVVDVMMKDGICFVMSIVSNFYIDLNIFSLLVYLFVEGCVVIFFIICNFIECIVVFLIKELLVLFGWKVI